MKQLSYLATFSVIALLLLMPAAGAQQYQYQEQSQTQGAATQQNPNVWSVAIEDFYFEPADAVIAPGDTIMWTNEGAQPHTVTADDGSFDSGVLNPGDSYMVTFMGEGTKTYHCSIHPSMVGSVTTASGVGGESAPTESTPSSGYLRQN